LETTQFKKNSIEQAYPNKFWLNQRGQPKSVLMLDFVEYKYNQGRLLSGQPKPYITDDGEEYIAEVWLVQNLETGEIYEQKFRKSIVTGDLTETSNPISINVVDDSQEANLLLDSLTEWMNHTVNRRIYPNKMLKQKNEELVNKIETIERILSEYKVSDIHQQGLFLILRHKQSPTQATFRSVQEYKHIHPHIYEDLLLIIKNETINNANTINIAIPDMEQPLNNTTIPTD